MDFISVFNDVLGPVMRGPSSSHTAGSYHIGRMARSLLGEEPASAVFTFDPQGSYAKTFREQGSDLSFAMGLLEWPIIDERFERVLELAANQGIKIGFRISPLEGADHPNTVKIDMLSRSGRELHAVARSMGGGMILFLKLDDWDVSLQGKSWEILIEFAKRAESQVLSLLLSARGMMDQPVKKVRGEDILLHLKCLHPLDFETKAQVEHLSGVRRIWTASPIFYLKRGEALFSSAKEMITIAQSRNLTLGEVALEYEAQILGLKKEDVLAEMLRRYEIMKSSVDQGLCEERVRMQLLQPSARNIFEAESKGKVAVGGLHARAAARAMAALHVSNSLGVVCAAPTGGSCGVIPGVVVTLAEEKNISPKKIVMGLFAASAVGLIIAGRATFAAEVAGCQVEIGAAGAMAAAAVVEIAGGKPEQAADAAAISLQNTMGSVCDLVQGICEIPCHTRNAAAASNAFLFADLILGGYKNPIPLDETIDAAYAVGKMLPSELRCTSLGGVAICPSARAMTRLR